MLSDDCPRICTYRLDIGSQWHGFYDDACLSRFYKGGNRDLLTLLELYQWIDSTTVCCTAPLPVLDGR